VKNSAADIAALDSNIAAVSNEDLLDERETDPVAAGFGSEKRNEDPVEVFG